MTEEILAITEEYTNDDSIESFQYIEKDANKTGGNLNTRGEMTITFNNEPAWMYLHDSYLRIERDFKTAGNADIANNSAVAFINNGPMHLFSNVRYILGVKN